MEQKDSIHHQLDDLERRITAKRAELAAQGVLHGAEREAAAEIDLKHSALRTRLAAARAGNGAIAQELAGDIEILRHLVDKWVARTDRRSEDR